MKETAGDRFIIQDISLSLSLSFLSLICNFNSRFMCEQCGHEAANPKALGYHIKVIDREIDR